VQAPREDEDEHEAQPEVRDGLPDEREHADGVVDGRLDSPRRQRPQQDAEDEGGSDRRGRELERRRQPFQHDGERRPPLVVRPAPVADGHLAQEERILHRERPVEPHLRALLRDHLRRGVRTEQDRGGIAGDDPHDQEDDRDDAPDHQKRRERAAEQVAAYGATDTSLRVKISLVGTVKPWTRVRYA